ncbi:MAG: hypothetical protein J6D23_02855 [Clostridia bacterium]|nr:hypothetical protein [Clostridia bacterium]
MKYTKPQLEIFQLETNDIIASSGEATISVGDITITGPKDEFAFDFSDLLHF